ncbi:NAD(P)/FAD-dependent oxidoreductase [Candidatus Enterococcus ferrettii]|uniref:FAD dependent oxidoreductase domain-containing protein n=1 Tax=Candidatus Enterococcus ferrettii TaxID=2815324 RepID=A0ABV0EUQ9_9ENTE|nr:FAD-dependent oxidoreductase [Enterococcus sp. 665A]MBO1339322.1 FAD-binding oxidoreductase [Enterococcus sp. 665A]
MEKIAIIGGGIIGLTLANYLDNKKFDVTLYDQSTGQATGASAGIISPWLSKRRNKQWYALAKDGANFFPQLIQDFDLDDSIYQRSGTLLLRKQKQLEELYELAKKRREEAAAIGEIRLFTEAETAEHLPLLKPTAALHISGGGRLDGIAYLQRLRSLAKNKGIHLVNQSITLKQTASLQVVVDKQTVNYDRIILTPGPHLKNLLKPLGYHTDIRPQKGQLLAFQTDYTESANWPVAMLDGEADLIPFAEGKILLGATHENDGSWDLTATKEAFKQLICGASEFLADPARLFSAPYNYRIGTRAYTSDFAPFFGLLRNELLVASGLGSSGLTTGPYIGYLLANYLNGKTITDWSAYQKPLENYIHR